MAVGFSYPGFSAAPPWRRRCSWGRCTPPGSRCSGRRAPRQPHHHHACRHEGCSSATGTPPERPERLCAAVGLRPGPRARGLGARRGPARDAPAAGRAADALARPGHRRRRRGDRGDRVDGPGRARLGVRPRGPRRRGGGDGHRRKQVVPAADADDVPGLRDAALRRPRRGSGAVLGEGPGDGPRDRGGRGLRLVAPGAPRSGRRAPGRTTT